MRRNLNAQGEGAQVRHLAQKIHGSFRITAFQLAIGGAHTAQGPDAAIGANRLAHHVGFANLFQRTFPTLLEIA